ncbi:hypothetical protein BB560_002710 [Smittium megazygosporum]|uniref:AB hydrolase-1 domain-containing protein n=1 Tax=Smittium megazygosporum TaxID=133381 RepID=A0A2T9ZDY4_9FUNG|nr:hypothetical protein BB560_002710 [Smittium megazygosporum]
MSIIDVSTDYILSSNHLLPLVNGQNILRFPDFTLENGTVIKEVSVGYKTWGTLNEERNNCMVICHAFTGSSDVADWWGPLLGKGRSFDTSRFFVVCVNVLGSPYGSSSPLTINPDTGKPYGPEFPLTSIRDDVALHRRVLDYLGVKQVAICIGGSLGGMHCLEWATFGREYVRTIIPIATSGKHSAWGISWGEAQRQMIYSDPYYNDGYYTRNQEPINGLSVARMSALLTYRSRDSFESRFGRKEVSVVPKSTSRTTSVPGSARNSISSVTSINNNDPNVGYTSSEEDFSEYISQPISQIDDRSASRLFSAQSYLRYQGDKFTKRFDANCYIALAKKMDTHDLGKSRGDYFKVLESINQPALVVGIETDGLFTFNEQIELASYMPNSKLSRIESYDGHDGFLLEFEQLNILIRSFIAQHLPEFFNPEAVDVGTLSEHVSLKGSVFGEVESGLSKW